MDTIISHDNKFLGTSDSLSGSQGKIRAFVKNSADKGRMPAILEYAIESGRKTVKNTGVDDSSVQIICQEILLS